jgi:hypothetical protein
MKASTWKAVFATMNPSPVFETLAEFAELMANEQRSTSFINESNGSAGRSRNGKRLKQVNGACRHRAGSI